jgi:D-alanine-D-alanine ligase
MRAEIAAAPTGPAPVAAKSVLDITVLMGGVSLEREVSLISGQAVCGALRRMGHAVTSADISPRDTSALDRQGADLVFIALHGDFGENGQVQQLCEDRGLCYVGSDPKASLLAMDKVASKTRFRAAGLPTPDWLVLSAGQDAARRAALLGEMPLPTVLKPIDGGSSVDVIIARDPAARQAGLQCLLAKYPQVLAEAFVAGRELTMGILGEQALPPIEIKTAREFYDYFAKYHDDATQYIVDPQLPPGLRQRLQDDALKAFASLDCRDLGRVDFILTADGTPAILEINTIPGFTSHSLLPKAAAAAGIGFDELCDRLARAALERKGV